MSNIDLVPANILILKDRQVVIDYEWTFDFPVPAGFILYRMIHYYLESDGKRRVLKDRDFMAKQALLRRSLLFMEKWKGISEVYAGKSCASSFHV